MMWKSSQVGGMLRMLSGSFLTLGDPDRPSSTFELVSEDFVMENSTLMVCQFLSRLIFDTTFGFTLTYLSSWRFPIGSDEY
jgi:hypothetical protein